MNKPPVPTRKSEPTPIEKLGFAVCLQNTPSLLANGLNFFFSMATSPKRGEMVYFVCAKFNPSASIY
jgi:hypothetical protein